MCKLQLVKKKKEKKKTKQKYGMQEGLYKKTMGEYIKVLEFFIIDFQLKSNLNFQNLDGKVLAKLNYC